MCIRDSILALDTMYINTIALLIVYGIHADLAIFFEAALLLSLIHISEPTRPY